MTRTNRTAVAALCATALWSSIGLASTEAPDLDERAAVRNAHIVVAGAFTAQRTEFEIEIPNARDADGNLFTDYAVYTAHAFVVAEVIDGDDVPDTVWINVPGRLELPPVGRQVVVGLDRDDISPNQGYTMVYGKYVEADSDDELTRVREWVRDVRAPEPIDPQLLEDARGQRDAEMRYEGPPTIEPEVPGTDDPAPERQPQFGAPTSAAVPNNASPTGSPEHPPEMGQRGAPALSQPTDMPAPPRRPTRRSSPTPDGTAASPTSTEADSRTRTWWFALGGGLLVLIGWAVRRTPA